MPFNDRLKQARQAAGLNQDQVGALVGLAKSTISQYENGSREPSMAAISKLMKALEVDANFLFQDEMNQLLKSESWLTDDEGLLIGNYRILDDEDKEKLIKISKGMVDAAEGKRFLEAVEVKENQGTA